MFFDPLYLLIAAPALLFMFYAQQRVSSTYKKYAKVNNESRKTGADVALILLRNSGITEVTVEETKGVLTDHYDPGKKKIRLSREVFHVPSVSAMGIVAHEVGHVLQDKEGYFPMRVRSAIVPAANVGTWLGYIFFVLGVLLSLSNLVWAGVIFFSGALVFALITLPVEFDASNRATKILLNNGLVTVAESHGVKSVLSAAALTYVAALLQAVSSLMYYILVATGMSRKE